MIEMTGYSVRTPFTIVPKPKSVDVVSRIAICNLRSFSYAFGCNSNLELRFQRRANYEKYLKWLQQWRMEI